MNHLSNYKILFGFIKQCINNNQIHQCFSKLKSFWFFSLNVHPTKITRCYYHYLHNSYNPVINNISFGITSSFNHHYQKQVAARRTFHFSSLNRKQQQQKANMAKLISGKEISEEIRTRLKDQVSKMTIKPMLAIVQVGGREDSNVYIRMKKNFIESVGGEANHVKLPRNTTQEQLSEEVKKLNQDPTVHGIIVQLPFDSDEPIDAHYITNLIAPNKDVDGLTVANAGNLLHGKISGEDGFVPCTPYGCMELIKKTGVKLEGANAVVIGRSKIVGSPMAQLLLWNDCTVTICHLKTKNLPEIVKTADILVVAIGDPLFIQKEWIKPGAVIIDCGITSIPDATKKSGYRLAGDVDFEGCKQLASYITPVPGGVGPMTVAMLIANTIESAKRFEQKQNGCKNGN